MKSIHEMGERWKSLNDQYDSLILKLIESPPETSLTEEMLSQLKQMQDELYQLEVDLISKIKDEQADI